MCFPGRGVPTPPHLLLLPPLSLFLVLFTESEPETNELEEQMKREENGELLDEGLRSVKPKEEGRMERWRE